MKWGGLTGCYLGINVGITPSLGNPPVAQKVREASREEERQAKREARRRRLEAKRHARALARRRREEARLADEARKACAKVAPPPPPIPLPEDFWQSRTGRVYRKNREYTVCPRCKETWKIKESAACLPCHVQELNGGDKRDGD